MLSTDFPSGEQVVCGLPCWESMRDNPDIKTAKHRGIFEQFSMSVTRATGSTPAFICAAAAVVLWLMAGPFFSFSQEWQLVINTGTTIITFLMVFVIQRAQNKESTAIQLKLNELVASYELASNRLVSVEDLTEEELQVLQKYYRKLAEMAKHSQHLQESHSIEEAEAWHHRKSEHHSIRRAKTKKNDSPKGEHTIPSGH